MTVEQLQRCLRVTASVEAVEVLNWIAVAVARAEEEGLSEREATIVLFAHFTRCASGVLKLDHGEFLREVHKVAAELGIASAGGEGGSC